MKIFIALLLSLNVTPLALAHGMSEADKLRAMDGGILEFLRQGAVHMITGYDHLLFLFGVVFFLTKFKDIVKFVTVFTLGHSITLIGATFLGIKADYFLIDAVIALTVCYKGFDNIGGFKKFFGMKSPNLLAMVFIFGLIHGFGLSTRLQTLTIGTGMDLLGKIIAFNIGVEGGQIAALVIIIGLLAGWRRTKSFQQFSLAANTSLIIVGGLLCLMQLHGFSHARNDLEVHRHAHEDLGVVATNLNTVSEGYHVDEPGGTPHQDHGDESGHGHSHGAADKYDSIITRIFDVRKHYRDAKTDEEIMEVHHPVSDIYQELVLLRQLITDIDYLDFAQIDVHMINVGKAEKIIDNQAHEGNVEKIKEALELFEENLLAIEELINHPVLKEGLHVDEPGGTPHKH